MKITLKDVSLSGGGSGGTHDHSVLINRDIPEQHPIGAVSGLQDTLDGKVDKVSGKGLSTNDYTTAEKNKLAAFDSADKYAKKTDVDTAIAGAVTAVLNTEV